MAYIIADRVKETTTSIGTETIALGGASTGYRRFADVMTVGDTCPYVIALNTEWEVGIATYSAANTLTRTTIHSSSNAGSAVNFSAGTKDVFLGPTAETVPEFNPITNTITSGVWGGSTIPVLKGGTGVTTSTGTGSVVLSNAPTLTTATFAAGTISASAPNAITQTWNNAAVTFSALTATITNTSSSSLSTLIDMKIGTNRQFAIYKDGTASVKGINFLRDDRVDQFNDLHIYATTNSEMYFQVGGDIQYYFARTAAEGFRLHRDYAISWTSGNAVNSYADVSIYRDAADTLAQRRSTNAQAFRVYNTYTDASSYERLVMDWSTTSNVGYIGFQRAGTGAQRNVIVDLGGNPTAGANRIHTVGTNTVEIWAGNTASIRFGGNNTYIDFFQYYNSGAIKPSNYGINSSGNPNRVADKFVFRALGGGTGNTATTYIGFGAAYVPAGVTSTQSHTQEDCFLVRLLASATPIVAFGDSFVSTVPAIKRVGTQLQVRLANDSADASFSAQYIKTPALTVATLPSASTAGMGSRAFVSDATATTFASVVAGGGSNKVPVYSDGTDWLIG